MIEQFFDEAIKKLGKYEFDLTELEDLQIWFETDKPSLDELSTRERVAFEYFKENGTL